MTTRVQTAGVAAGLMALVLAGCSDSPKSGEPVHQVSCCDDTPTALTGFGPAPVPGTYRDNRKAAAAESRRVAGLVPVPPGSTRLTSPPTSWSGPPDITEGPSDATLTRTAWWTVPGDAHSIQRQLLGRRPAGMRREDGVGGGSDGIRVVDYVQRTSPNPTAYLPVDLQVMWGPSKTQDGMLIVRADTFTAARAERDPRSLVTGRVASVDIRQVRSFRDGHTRRMPEVHLTRRHDRTAIAHLVRAVDALNASIRPLPALPCPYPPQPPPRVALTFHLGPHGSQVMTMTLDAWCFGQVHTTRNGHPVRPPLDPGSLVTTVDHLTARRTPRA